MVLQEHSRSGGMKNIVNFLALLLIWRGMFGTVMLVSNVFSANVYFALYMCWLLFASIQKRDFLGNVFKTLWPILVFVVINIGFDIAGGLGVTKETINIINAFMMSSMFVYYMKEDVRFKKIALFLIIIDFGIIIYSTSNQLNATPNLVRSLSTRAGEALEDTSMYKLIANFSTVYAIVTYTVFLMFARKYIVNKGLRFFALALILFLTLFVIKCTLFIAVTLIAMGLLINFFPQKKSVPFLLVGGFLLIIMFFSGPLAALMTNMARTPFWGEILQGKFLDIANLLTGGSSSAYMSEMRIELYKQSIDVFAQNPFFGVHAIAQTDFKIGMHSGWLDGLANYGLIRYPFYIGFVIKLYQAIRDHVPQKYQYGVLVVFFTYFMFGSVNPNVFPQIWTILCFAIPFSISIIEENNAKKLAEEKNKEAQWKSAS